MSKGIILVLVLAVLAIFFISNPSLTGNIVNDVVDNVVKPSFTTHNRVLRDGQYLWLQLNSQDTELMISSDEEVDIFIFASKSDVGKWLQGETARHYPSYEAGEVFSYQRNINVPQGSYLVVSNPSILGLGDPANIVIKIR